MLMVVAHHFLWQAFPLLLVSRLVLLLSLQFLGSLLVETDLFSL